MDATTTTVSRCFATDPDHTKPVARCPHRPVAQVQEMNFPGEPAKPVRRACDFHARILVGGGNWHRVA